MCKERKYNEYKIVVTYLNGDKETISYQDKNIDNSSYKEMMVLYKETKELYKNDSVDIHFCGISKDGELNIIFTKEIKGEDYEIKKEAEEIQNISSIDMVENLKIILDNIGEKCHTLSQRENILNKAQDVELHKLDDKNRNFSDIDKIEFFNKIQDIRQERREVKNEWTVLNALFCQGGVQKIKSSIKSAEKSHQTLLKKQEEIKENGVETFVSIKKYKYRNFKERVNLIKTLQPKYDKVYYDDSKMVVTCYNKSYK